jgi:hypothetical protein
MDVVVKLSLMFPQASVPVIGAPLQAGQHLLGAAVRAEQ